MLAGALYAVTLIPFLLELYAPNSSRADIKSPPLLGPITLPMGQRFRKKSSLKLNSLASIEAEANRGRARLKAKEDNFAVFLSK